MDYINTSAYTNAEKQQLHQLQFEHDLQYQRAHDENAVLVPFLLNSQALSQLRQGFAHRRVYVARDARPRASHPVAASLLWYAKNDLFLETARKERVVDIGGNLLDVIHRKTADHTCLMSTSSRDRHRYLTSLYSAGGDVPTQRITHDAAQRIWNQAQCTERVNWINYDIPIDIHTSPRFCMHGAEKCRHQGETMTSIHSLYDMTPEQVWLSFEAHGANTLLAWAFFPPELFDEYADAAVVRRISGVHTWYTCKMVDSKMTMRFNDGSFYYSHDRHNWRRWLRINRIRGSHFDVVIEVQEQVGIMFKLRMTRVPISRDNLLAHEISYPFLSDYVRVPDIYTYVENHGRTVYTPAPRLLVSRILNQALKAPEINANSIHTLAVACITRIDVADTVVNKFVNISADELDRVVYSVILIAAAHRQRRTRDFAAFVGLFRADLESSNSLCGVGRKLWRLYDQIAEGFSCCSSTPSGVYDLEILSYEPLECDQFLTVNCGPERLDNILTIANRPIEACASDIAEPPPPTTTTQPPTVADPTPNNRTVVVTDADVVAVIDALCDSVAAAVDVPALPPPYHYVVPTPRTVAPIAITPSPLSIADTAPKWRERPVVESRVTPFDFLSTCPADLELERLDRADYLVRDAVLPSRNGGGTRASRKLMAALHGFDPKGHVHLLDIGAGPGAFGRSFRASCPYATIHGLTYGVPVTAFNSTAYNSIVYADVNSLTDDEIDKYAADKLIIVCDIGGLETFNACYLAVHNILRRLCTPLTGYVIKMFTPTGCNESELAAWRLFTSTAHRCAYYRPTSSGEQNREFYFIGQGFCAPHFAGPDCDAMQQFYNKVELSRRAAVYALASRFLVSNYDPAHELLHSETKSYQPEAVLQSFFRRFCSDAPKEIANRMRMPPALATNIKYRVLGAVPAAGKTAHVRRLIGSKLFVVPTRKLANTYIAAHLRAVTFHVYFTKPYSDVDHLIIDEAFTFRLPFVHAVASHTGHKHLWLLGDHFQIGAIDFSDDARYTEFDRVPPPEHYNTHSLAMPHDIATICTGTGYPRITTSSKVVSSIVYFDATSVDDIPKIKQRLSGVTQVIVYNQETADEFTRRSTTSETIHACQGDRPDNVIFYYDERAIDTGLHNSIEHIRVLMSRHTEKLVFIGQTHHMRKIVDYYGSNISINLDRYRLKFHDNDVHVDVIKENGRYNVVALPVCVYREPAVFDSVDADTACDILAHILPESDVSNFATLINTTAPFHGQGRMIIKMERVLEKMRTTHVSGEMVSQHSFALRHFPTSMAVLKCLGDRYTKITPKSSAMDDAVVELFNAAGKAMAPFDAHEYPPVVTTDDFANRILTRIDPKVYNVLQRLQALSRLEGMFEHHLVGYMESLDKKQIPRDEYDQILGDSRDFWLSFFPKRQVKPKLADGWSTSDKAPQGIAAFKKNVNMLYAAYGRMLSQFLDQLFDTNVIFASNHPESEISARIAAAYEKHDPAMLKEMLERASSDFSEFDSTQNKVSFYFMSVLYAVLGMPQQLLDRYRTNCESWVMADDAVRLHGYLMMHSGSFETLVRNSLIGLANNCVVYRWDTLVLILFKGDDFHVEGFRVEFAPGTWLRDNGLSIKHESPPIGEFAGKFVLLQGSAPDVLRRSVKYVSTVYRDISHHAMAVQSLASDFECLTSQSHVDAAIDATVRFYSRSSVLRRPPTHADVRMLFGFLHAHAVAGSHALHHVTLPVAHVSTAAGSMQV